MMMNILRKKALIIVSLAILTITTGCSSLPDVQKDKRFEWLAGSNTAYGDAPGDICISCGENFTFIPNEELGAVKQAKREGWCWGCGVTPRY